MERFEAIDTSYRLKHKDIPGGASHRQRMRSGGDELQKKLCTELGM